MPKGPDGQKTPRRHRRRRRNGGENLQPVKWKRTNPPRGRDGGLVGGKSPPPNP